MPSNNSTDGSKTPVVAMTEALFEELDRLEDDDDDDDDDLMSRMYASNHAIKFEYESLDWSDSEYDSDSDDDDDDSSPEDSFEDSTEALGIDEGVQNLSLGSLASAPEKMPMEAPVPPMPPRMLQRINSASSYSQMLAMEPTVVDSEADTSQLTTNAGEPMMVSPEDKLQQMLQRLFDQRNRHSSKTKSRSHTYKYHIPDDYFVPLTKTRQENYTPQAVAATRSRDVAQLCQLLAQGHSLDACNAQSESLLSLACRRQSLELVQLLVQEAGISPRVRDDCYKNALHDSCWSAQPNMEVVKLLLQDSPALLWAKDQRGHTPLQYAPRQSWALWCDFLEAHAETLLQDCVEHMEEDYGSVQKGGEEESPEASVMGDMKKKGNNSFRELQVNVNRLHAIVVRMEEDHGAARKEAKEASAEEPVIDTDDEENDEDMRKKGNHSMRELQENMHRLHTIVKRLHAHA